MRKFNVMILVSLVTIAFAAAIVMAGVTEIKVYTNENTMVYTKNATGEWIPSESGRGSYLGHPNLALEKVNAIVPYVHFHDDLWVTTDAAAGPYAENTEFSPGGDKRLSWHLGHEGPIDASATERITFWIKAEDELPLWMRTYCPTLPDGVDVEGPAIMIDGETIVRQDDFGFHYAASDKPWSGEWQFVSIPWTYFHLTAEDMELTDTGHSLGGLPWSWAGDLYWDSALDRHHGGPYFDESTLSRIAFEDKDGTETGTGDPRLELPLEFTYPWPAGRNPEAAIYSFDEIVLTLNEGTDVTDVDGNPSVMPLTYDLGNNYPNPFNPSTTISYGLPVSNQVLIEVYNTLGQKVRTLVDRYMTAGVYNTTWDATDDDGNFVPSGVYFYKMQSSHFKSVKKMILTK
jgi:hypothetical protein